MIELWIVLNTMPCMVPHGAGELDAVISTVHVFRR